MRLIGFDFETHLIRPGILAPRAVCLSVAGRGEPPKYLPQDADSWWRSVEDGWEAVFHRRHIRGVWGNLAGDSDITLVAHNLPFDLGVLIKKEMQFIPDVFVMLEKGRLRDTLVREKLINIAYGNLDFDQTTKKKQGYSLAALVLKHFGVDISETKGADSWRLRYSELEFLPIKDWPLAALVYSAQDSTWARRLFQKQTERPLTVRMPNESIHVHNEGLVQNELEQTAAAFALHLMACRGVVTDAAAVRNFKIAITDQVDDARKIASELGFMRHNGTKNLKVLRALVEDAYAAHRKPLPFTAKGFIKTDKKTLEKSENPRLVEYSKLLNAEKLLTTYLPILEQGTKHPICSQPNVLVRSGRISWRKPNLQNPPRKSGFRACFIPQPGNVFCSVDYASIELRCLAQVQLDWYGKSKLAEAFKRGEDPHLQLGARILYWEGGLEMAKTAYADENHPDHHKIKNARQFAKIANFGFPGGLAPETFVQYCAGFGKFIDSIKARELKVAWMEEWEETNRYLMEIKQKMQLTQTIVQIKSGRIRGDVNYTAACNSFFQGLAADGIKFAAWELAKKCYCFEEPFQGVYPWVLIHDEIIAEGPEDTAHIWGPAMADVMVRTMSRFVPDVPIEAAPALMRRWHKDATSVYDESGKLLVWESPDERKQRSCFTPANSD